MLEVLEEDVEQRNRTTSSDACRRLFKLLRPT
jgi:hypothetical protein